MDLNVSPDLSALCCYGIVFLLGIWVAAVQVKKRLGGMEGVWFHGRTWVLLSAYAIVPVALFWLLDRTSAIADTAFFAAILVGVGYERIITGRSQNIQVGGDVSAIWTPLVAYADRVSKAVLERSARDQLRLAEKIIAEISSVPERYAGLEAFALSRSTDRPAVEAALKAIDQSPTTDADKAEKKTRYLYGLMLSVPDIHYLLKNKTIISPKFYFLQIRDLRRFSIVTIVIVLLVCSAFAPVWTKYGDITTTYHVWRLGKTNSTGVDQYRSRHRLVKVMQAEEPRKQATAELTYLVQRPGLPLERVSLILETLLQAHEGFPKKDLALHLIPALRATGLDARVRVNEALVFLAKDCSVEPKPELKAWKATEKESSTLLEEKIGNWRRYWDTTDCVASKLPT